MFDLDKHGSKLFAAALSLTLSAVFFATAIIPATPGGILA